MSRSKNQVVLKSIPAKTVIRARFAVMIVAIYVLNRSLAVQEITRKKSRHQNFLLKSLGNPPGFLSYTFLGVVKSTKLLRLPRETIPEVLGFRLSAIDTAMLRRTGRGNTA